MAEAELRAKFTADDAQWKAAVQGVHGDIANLGHQTSEYSKEAVRAGHASAAMGTSLVSLAGVSGPATGSILALSRALTTTRGDMKAFQAGLMGGLGIGLIAVGVSELIKLFKDWNSAMDDLSAAQDRVMNMPNLEEYRKHQRATVQETQAKATAEQWEKETESADKRVLRRIRESQKIVSAYQIETWRAEEQAKDAMREEAKKKDREAIAEKARADREYFAIAEKAHDDARRKMRNVGAAGMSISEQQIAESPVQAMAELELLGGGAGMAEHGAMLMEAVAKAAAAREKEQAERARTMTQTENALAAANEALARERERQARDARMEAMNVRIDKAREQQAAAEGRMRGVRGKLDAIGAGESIMDERKLANMTPAQRREYRKELEANAQLGEKLARLRGGERVRFTQKERARMDALAEAEGIGAAELAKAGGDVQKAIADREAAERAQREIDNHNALEGLNKKAEHLKGILDALLAGQIGRAA
jgi:hypothetical protein